ncbi:MAG: ribosomal-processing cysteine protease Prp [Clostridia bacterium]|nr:ribosomal-processing cysteine protease Prp [Clostridia bacterium]
MTTIKIFKQKGKIKGFECSGHTGFGERGQDILCSAISTLVGSCHLGLSKVLGFETDFKIDEENGYFALSIEENALENQSAQLLFEVFAESIKDLALDYQKFIKLKIIGG